MKQYCIRQLPETCAQLPLTGEFDPAVLPAPWNQLEEAALEDYPWDENGYRPPCFARVGWNSRGLHVLMYAKEAVVRRETRHFGGMVCQDSCMEFFVQCNPEKTEDYINLESNGYPVMLIGFGPDRHHRIQFEEPRGIAPQASEHRGGWWALSYTVPANVIEQLFGVTLASGQKMRGNFFICGDKTEYPHYGMWNGADPAVFPKPDFHQPVNFAPMVLE